MATVYARNQVYAKAKKKQMLTEEERSVLGREVMDAFMRVKKPEKIIHYRKFINERGEEVKVIDYPRDFTPVIDKYIELYYVLNK